jgi:transcriptional regulator with XRE-family HTH domain
MPDNTPNSLAAFLKDRRTRLDPGAFGFSGRRRTPGLRREEVAQRANISPTWYTWLEQGRGGAPSADVLNRIASGLMLTEPEREHLFMLGLGRPPEVRYKSTDGITPRLQRLLDTLDASPAFIKTATWDVVAWNAAAAVVLTDYGKLPEGQRNLLRQIFSSPSLRAKQHDWEGLARFVVGAFRADAARAGAMSEVADLVDELSKSSPEFAAFWGKRCQAAERWPEEDRTSRIWHRRAGIFGLLRRRSAGSGHDDLQPGRSCDRREDPAACRGACGSREILTALTYQGMPLPS